MTNKPDYLSEVWNHTACIRNAAAVLKAGELCCNNKISKMILWMCQSRGQKCVVQHQQLLFGLLPVLMCLSTSKTQNGLPARLWSLLLSMPCRSESNVWHAELQAVWFNSDQLMVNFVWMAMCVCCMSLWCLLDPRTKQCHSRALYLQRLHNVNSWASANVLYQVNCGAL